MNPSRRIARDLKACLVAGPIPLLMWVARGLFVMELLGLWIWVASIAAGVIIASQRNNATLGFFLCVMLGPVGMIACAFIDARVRCPQCGTHLNEAPNQCPSCWARFRWNKGKTQCEFIPFEFRRNEPQKHSEPQ